MRLSERTERFSSISSNVSLSSQLSLHKKHSTPNSVDNEIVVGGRKESQISIVYNASQRVSFSERQTTISVPPTPTLKTRFSDDVFIKAYNQARRRSTIISDALDDDIKECLQKSLLNSKCKPGQLNECLSPLVDRIENRVRMPLRNMSISEKPELKLERKRSSRSVANLTKEKSRFSSFLSNEALYALFKAYEDMIIFEIEKAFPDLKQAMPRTATPVNLTRNIELFKNYKNLELPPRERMSAKAFLSHHNNVGSYFKRNTRHFSVFDFDNYIEEIDEMDLNRRYQISKHLEDGMDILDSLKGLKTINNTKIPIMPNVDDVVWKYKKWVDEWPNKVFNE